jgi:hypothetical protein
VETVSGIEITLTEDRSEVHQKIDSLKDGWRVLLKGPKRSLDQNALMWARLQDLADQIIWYGQRLTAENWKDVCSASLRNAKVVPTIDGDGFVVLGLRTSEMSDDEMGVMLDLIEAFGAQNNVRWKAAKWLIEMANQQRTAKKS